VAGNQEISGRNDEAEKKSSGWGAVEFEASGLRRNEFSRNQGLALSN
jgi:hypothetical protein